MINKKITILLIILVLANMSAFVMFLGMDVVAVINPFEWHRFDETSTKLVKDMGKFLIISQNLIISGIDRLESNDDLSYMDRMNIHAYIIGGVAFSIFLPLLLMSFLGYLHRAQTTSFSAWFLIIIVSIIIISVIQVIVSFVLFEKITWPFSGIIHLVQNFDVFINSWMVTAPTNIFDIG